MTGMARPSAVRLAKIFAAAAVGLALMAPSARSQAVDPASIPSSVVFGNMADLWVGEEETRVELIAVSPDTLWIENGGAGRVALNLADVSRIRVRMHEWDTRRVVIWSLIGGIGTGAALAGACSTLDDTSCGGVFPGVAAVWALAGLIFGGTLADSSGRDVGRDVEAIQPYVRFPQGLPSGAETPSSNP